VPCGASVSPDSGVKNSFQWFRNGSPISGATNQTYKLKDADAGASIKVKVRLTKSGYESVSKTSAPVTIKAAGSWDNPMSWGSSLGFEEGLVKVTVGEPTNVTADLVGKGALNPATGNAYWLVKVTVLNDSTRGWHVSKLSERKGIALAFEADNGRVYRDWVDAEVVEKAGWRVRPQSVTGRLRR